MTFDEFFDQEQEALLRFCWLLTLDRAASADIAQESMTRAWKNWPTLGQPGNNPAGWVRTVAANLARSRWRRLRRLALSPVESAERSTRATPVSDPDLIAALGQLAMRQREAVALRYWADLTLDDCASAMGVSAGAVKQHLSRAHAKLRHILDETALEELTL